MIELIIVSFFAGVLTVFAPCILPLLPVILGAGVINTDKAAKKQHSLLHPIIIVASLVVSVIVFTLLLKATTLLLGVPTTIWSIIAGGIVLFFGVNLVLPVVWDKLMIVTGLQAFSNRLLGKAQTRRGIGKDILLGAALGPVFNSCSPTYALIVATILPASFATGLLYLAAYAVGLGVVLLLIAVFGRAFIQKSRWLSNPEGSFRKIIGVIFIIVGIVIISGVDKTIQTYVLEQGWYDWVMRTEESVF
jgi:cytochrome c-type biogenesis protein